MPTWPAGLPIVVYDAETKNEVDGTHVTWETPEKMGIAVVCAFDYLTGDYRVFLEDNLQELVTLLNAAKLVVGFNILGFDNPLLRASGLDVRPNLPCYDMLEKSRRSLGWEPGEERPRGCRLDNHLEATFGSAFKKTGDGADAPKLYQTNQIGKLVSYCLADVRRERLLFEHIVQEGWVRTAAHGQRNVVQPQDVWNELYPS